MKMSDLTSDCQWQYDSLIDYINDLTIDTEDKQCLIDRIDDLIDWILTTE